MSYSDYLAGLHDGFVAGFNAGYRRGLDDSMGSGYLAGYRDGYYDGSCGLPYRPQARLMEYRVTLPDPPILPRIDPLPKFDPPILNCEPPQLLKLHADPKLGFSPKYEPPPLLNLDLGPKLDLIPKYEPLPPVKLAPEPKYELPVNLVDPLGRRKRPWEY